MQATARGCRSFCQVRDCQKALTPKAQAAKPETQGLTALTPKHLSPEQIKHREAGLRIREKAAQLVAKLVDLDGGDRRMEVQSVA